MRKTLYTPYGRLGLCLFKRTTVVALNGLEPVNYRIILATFNTRNKNIKVNVVQCYAPRNDADNGKKEEFYNEQ